MHRPTPRPATASVPQRDEPLLVERALLGDAGSYEELYRRHRDRVARVAYLLLGDSDQAQETAQEAFLIGWRDLRGLRDPALFRPWVTGVAVNLCRRRRRASARALKSFEQQRGRPGEASDELDTAALRLVVRAAVDGLPRQMREVVVLRFYCGFAEGEMAEALGVAPGTVKSRLGRARARLARTLRAVVEVE